MVVRRALSGGNEAPSFPDLVGRCKSSAAAKAPLENVFAGSRIESVRPHRGARDWTSLQR